MTKANNINVFWWSSVKFEGKPQENFGDVLSKYLVEKISGKSVVWKNPEKQSWNPFQAKIYTTTGSILKHISKRCIVWGSGIISKSDEVEQAQFLAVRGPETYDHLVAQGYKVNKVFGDPAILLPFYYNPKIDKQFTLGIIPHYVDYDKVCAWFKNDRGIRVINLLNDDVEAVTDAILSCEQIVSSSLHGVIVAHTYKIPAIWVQFSDKLSGDNVKFVDYFKSVNLQPYTGENISSNKEISDFENLLIKHPNIPSEEDLIKLRTRLLEVCPFKQ